MTHRSAQGEWGAVYRAWDARLERFLAIKVLHGSGQSTKQLQAEARAAAAVEHRAIVGIHDVGEAAGMHYVAMEFVDGESMRSVFDSGALGDVAARDLMLELAEGLAAAHAKGVVHRDLKPENLVKTHDGVKILDFGLARIEGKTVSLGRVNGTAGYMAPEQVRGQPGDERTDLFALGAIAYEAAVGERAFPGSSRAERLSATLEAKLDLDGVGELGPLIARCLEKEPRDRFHSAADLAWAVRALSMREAPTTTTNISRRALLVGGVGVGVAGLAGYLIGAKRKSPRAAPVLRPLTHRTGRIYTARFTPDGGRAVYGAAWDERPVMLHVVELASGETTLLDLPSADLFAVSVRGDLAISVGHRFTDHQSARGELRVAPLAGGDGRPLSANIQDADFERPNALPGSATVGGVAVVRPTPRGFRIELPLGETLIDENGWITDLRIAPDGSQVAYLLHPGTNDDAGAVKVIDVETKEARVLTDGWASIAGLAWDPTGRGVWFTGSRESLNSTLFRVSLDGFVTSSSGQSEGRLRLHDVHTDGRALVSKDLWRLRAMAGEHDRSLSNLSFVSDLSRDGQHLVVGELGDLEAGIGTYLIPYSNGRSLRLGPGFPLAISPSGRQVAANENEKHRLIVYSTDSGTSSEIAAPGFMFIGRWVDERAIIGLYDHKLWRLSFDHQPEQLTDSGNPFALDPTRSRCAFVDREARLQVIDLATGEATYLPGNWNNREVCGWLETSGAIAIRSTTTPIQIDRVDPTTGLVTHHKTVKPPALGLKAVDSFVLHSDGERFGYSFGQELSQLYLMSGFD